MRYDFSQHASHAGGIHEADENTSYHPGGHASTPHREASVSESERTLGRCPSCGAPGRKVGAETLDAMLEPDDRARVSETIMRFCRTTTCAVGYFAESDALVIDASRLRAEVFQKSTSPERLVCYCFDHRVSELLDDVARDGDSMLPAEIAEKCRQGLDRCAQTNPQGSCCLGNVRAVLTDARASAGPTPDEEPARCASHCCGGDDESSKS